MTRRVYNVLFLCTGNSARSIIAECVLNRLGDGRFRAFSAGSFPAGYVHPDALELLRRLEYPTEQLRSKSWCEFAHADAPRMDFVFTVCGKAADEVCPVWPGQPTSAHWGVPDPAAVPANQGQRSHAFANTLRMLSNRIGVLVNLPLETIDQVSLNRKLHEIGAVEEISERTD